MVDRKGVLSRQLEKGATPATSDGRIVRKRHDQQQGCLSFNPNGCSKEFSIRIVVRMRCHIFTSLAKPRQIANQNK
jgi:hypothetical protein